MNAEALVKKTMLLSYFATQQLLIFSKQPKQFKYWYEYQVFE